MRLNHLAVILGFTNTVVASTELSVQAQATNYQVQSGTTSLSLDRDLFDSLGLELQSAPSTTTPASGFDFGFSILPPSSDPSLLGTDFTFSHDDATSTFTPVSGTIEHTGSLVFNVNTEKLALLSPLETGDFSIGFDDDGFFIRDTASTGLQLFDLGLNTNSGFDGKNLQVNGVDVLISQEFSDALGYAAGSNLDLAGVKVGQAQINATAVPEPEVNSALALLMTAGVALAIRQRRRSCLSKDASTAGVKF